MLFSRIFFPTLSVGDASGSLCVHRSPRLPFFREYYTSFSLGEYPSSKSVRSIHVARSGEDCRPVNWEFAATMNRYLCQCPQRQYLPPEKVPRTRRTERISQQ
eukprot:1918594-Amphidinium_carterae.1